MKGEGRLYDRSVLTGLVPDPLLGVIDSLPPHRAAAYFNADIQVGSSGDPQACTAYHLCLLGVPGVPFLVHARSCACGFARTFILRHLRPPSTALTGSTANASTTSRVPT